MRAYLFHTSVAALLMTAGLVGAGNKQTLQNDGAFSADTGQQLASKEAAGGGGTVKYALTEDAMYLEGCFGGGPLPCMCPIKLANSFEGQFGLKLLPGGSPITDYYEVSDILWTVDLGTESFQIIGGGTYVRTIGPDQPPIQSMTLELSIDGGDPQVFKSGPVPVPPDAAWPAIDITVQMPDSECFNIVMVISAEPV